MTNGKIVEVPREDAALCALLEASIPFEQARRAGNVLTGIPAAAPLTTSSQNAGSQEHHSKPVVPDVYRGICQVAKAISREGISKDEKNQQQGYSFRGIDAIYNALSALLAGADLLILPRMVSRSQEERTTAKGGVLFYVVVQADFDFVSSRDGSKHTVTMYGEAMDSADKATNKAMSAAYKYACLQVFCIPTEGMADADATTPKVAPAPKPTVPPAPAKPWSTISEMVQEFRKVEPLLPPETYARILSDHGVQSADGFRRGPRTKLSENAAIALACYHKLLHVAAEYQAAQDPTTYEHFKASEAWA